MPYKGEDMDLRTPPSYTPVRGQAEIEPVTNGKRTPRNGSGLPHGASPDATIWVDDVLLTTCNHAFDVAFAHRAAQVRIEHLLYALTRVDPATQTLEENGVRDAGLRRESAMVIASTIPVATTDDQTRPQGSAAVKEALELASAHAASFNRAAGVDDLLRVFTVLRPDLPGLDLLRRHMSSSATGGLQTYPQTHHVKPQTYAPPLIPRNAANATADIMQDNRLDALEQMVRALSRDIALERQAHAEGSIQGEVPAYIATPAPQPRPAYTTPAAPPAAPYPAPPVAGAPLEQFETGLVSKLDLVAGQLERLDGRLTNLEHSISRRSALGDTEFKGRLDALEELIKSAVIAEHVDFSPLDARLNDIEIALLSQDGTPGGNANIIETIEDLRKNFAHSIDDLRHILNERIDKLGENSSAQFTAVHNELTAERTAHEEAGAAIGAELKALSGASATHAASTERNLASTREQVTTLTQKIEKLEADNLETRGNFVEELREVHEAVMKLNSNQHTLGDSITNWHHDHLRDLDAIGERLAVVDTNTSKPLDEIQRVSTNVAKLSANMDAMYRATIERYHRRNRFWFWLFGTDDWVGASWPSQTARIEDELRALKNIRDKS